MVDYDNQNAVILYFKSLIEEIYPDVATEIKNLPMSQALETISRRTGFRPIPLDENIEKTVEDFIAFTDKGGKDGTTTQGIN